MRYWKSIKPSEKVVETRSGWEVNGEGVYWNGSEALKAQRWLHKRAVSDRRKK